MAYQKLQTSSGLAVIKSATVPIPDPSTEVLSGTADFSVAGTLTDVGTTFTSAGIQKNAIVYNTTAQKAYVVSDVTDNLKLAGLIQEIVQDIDISDLSQTMPYSEEELQNYVELFDFDWEQFKQNPTDDDTIDITITVKVAKGIKSIFDKLLELKEKNRDELFTMWVEQEAKMNNVNDE